jgi:hypothetical protein
VQVRLMVLHDPFPAMEQRLDSSMHQQLCRCNQLVLKTGGTLPFIPSICRQTSIIHSVGSLTLFPLVKRASRPIRFNRLSSITKLSGHPESSWEMPQRTFDWLNHANELRICIMQSLSFAFLGNTTFLSSAICSGYGKRIGYRNESSIF